MLDRLINAIGRDDPKAFASAVSQHWRKYGIEPPPDRCDPHIRGYLFVLKEPKVEERCMSTGNVVLIDRNSPPAPAPTNPKDYKEWLIKMGLLECRCVLVKEEPELKILNKFVRGICPPGPSSALDRSRQSRIRARRAPKAIITAPATRSIRRWSAR